MENQHCLQGEGVEEKRKQPVGLGENQDQPVGLGENQDQDVVGAKEEAAGGRVICRSLCHQRG